MNRRQTLCSHSGVFLLEIVQGDAGSIESQASIGCGVRVSLVYIIFAIVIHTLSWPIVSKTGIRLCLFHNVVADFSRSFPEQGIKTKIKERM